MVAPQPFQWIGSQSVSTPEAARRRREVADALLATNATPKNWTEGIASVLGSLSANKIYGDVAKAEEEGISSAALALSGLGSGSSIEDISAALSNPWITQPQASVASALLQQNLERQDPMYQLQLEQAQMEAERMRNPQPSIYDTNAPTSFQEWQLGQANPEYGATLGNDQSLVTVNAGTNNDFFSGLGAAEGEMFSGFLTGGAQAARNLAQVDQLDSLLKSSKTGLDGAATLLAGEFGIDLGGASGVQAAQALINQMVPAQRQPGSGPMSDADLALFKQSLPRIINQPGGNDLIIDTLRQINAYDMELARITQEGLALAEQSTDPQERAQIKAEMRRQINSLQNPITPFRQRISATPTGEQALPSLPAGVTSITRLN